MNERQRRALELRETDTRGAIRRMCDSEELYTTCLSAFMNDKTVEQINSAIKNASWDEAFTAAHALKGVAGNMGFVPLMHNTSRLIVIIRRGQTSEMSAALEQVNSAYRDIMDGIHQYFIYADEKSKENQDENRE